MKKTTQSGSGLTPTTQSSPSPKYGRHSDEEVYSSVDVVIGKAPLTWAASLSHISHKADCIREGSVYHVASEIHTTRGFCLCMSPYDIDKQVCLELLARELAVDSFFCLLPMVDRYGVDKILRDPELTVVLVRYDFLSLFYNVINKDKFDDANQLGRPLPWLPLLDAKHHSFVGNSKLPRIEDVISLTSWNRLCDFVQKRVRLHYLRDYANWFGNYTLVKVLAIPDFLFAGFKTCSEEPSKAIIRIDCYLDASLEAVMSVMSETDMTKDWVPYFRFPMHVGLECCETLRRLGRMEKVTYYKIALPWPFSDEEVILHGWLVDDLSANDRLVICFRGIDDDYPVTPSLGAVCSPDRGKNKRMYVEGGCRIRVEDEHRVRLEMLWNIDLKMSIPSTLVKFVAKTFVKAGINSLKGVCKSAETDSAWTARREECPWLYGFIADRLDSVLASMTRDKRSGYANASTMSKDLQPTDSASPRRKRDLFRRSRVTS